jgi:hypothetical protein
MQGFVGRVVGWEKNGVMGTLVLITLTTTSDPNLCQVNSNHDQHNPNPTQTWVEWTGCTWASWVNSTLDPNLGCVGEQHPMNTPT